jgi:hypothetical protein
MHDSYNIIVNYLWLHVSSSSKLYKSLYIISSKPQQIQVASIYLWGMKNETEQNEEKKAITEN